jgi:hypothetical protein
MAIRVVEFSNGGYKIIEILPKNQYTQRKLLSFEFQINGKLSKRAKIWLSKSIFYVKNHPNISQLFFSLKNTNLGANFLLLTLNQFLNHFITKMRPYFWQLVINRKLKVQKFPLGMLILFARIFLILYPPLENSTTRIAIMDISAKIRWGCAISPCPSVPTALSSASTQPRKKHQVRWTLIDR